MADPVIMVDLEGNPHQVPAEAVQRSLDAGWTIETDVGRVQRLAEEHREEYYRAPAAQVVAGGAALLRGASGGLSDVGLRAMYGAEGARDLRELRDRNPGVSIGGEIVGALATAVPSGGASLATLPGQAARVGRAIARTGEGAGALTRIGRAAAGAGAEGAIVGAGAGASELALSEDPLTFERVASVLSSNMLYGGAIGAGAGTVAKTAEIGLGRAKGALDEWAAARTARGGIAEDLTLLDRKGLREARTAELEAIEASRVPVRAELAGDIAAHRTALKDEKIWLATANAKERELREIGKISLDADKQLDRLLNNPKLLAEEPERALRSLQQQEHALERLAAHRPPTVDPADDVLAIETWQGGEHRVLNARLRGTKHFGETIGDDYTLTSGKTVGDTVRQLDDVIERAEPLAETRTLYRGVARRGKPRVGEVVTDKGFQGAAVDPQVAHSYASLRGLGDQKSQRILELEVPAGTKGVSLAEDGEFLLPRGTSYEITEVAGDRIRARVLPQQARPSARADALEKLPAALERNRAIQAKLRELKATPNSPRLQQIDEAKELLESGGRGERTIAEQMLQGAVFSGVTGLASAVPVVGPYLAPFVGAKAARLLESQVFGRLTGALTEQAQRGAAAVSRLLDTSKRATKAVPPIATRVLASVRFAPAAADDEPRRGDMVGLFKRRSEELRSQTMYTADGGIEMRPDAREALAARLAPIRAVDPLGADRLETIAARRVEFLAAKLPRRPDIGGLPLGGPDRWQPSEMEMRRFARYVAAVEDPIGIIERVADGAISPEDAEVMRAVYPEMHAAFTQQIVAQLPTLRTSLPFARRLSLSIFTGAPVDPSLDPRILRVLQAQHQMEEGTEGGTQAPRAQPQFGSLTRPEPTQAQERAG